MENKEKTHDPFKGTYITESRKEALAKGLAASLNKIESDNEAKDINPFEQMAEASIPFEGIKTRKPIQGDKGAGWKRRKQEDVLKEFEQRTLKAEEEGSFISKKRTGPSGSTWCRDKTAIADEGVSSKTVDELVDQLMKQRMTASNAVQERAVTASSPPGAEKPIATGSGHFLDQAKIKIDGKVADDDSVYEEGEIKYIKDVDLKPLTSLPKLQKPLSQMRWYERIWFKIRNFFIFIWTYWEVKKERAEREKFIKQLRLVVDNTGPFVSGHGDRRAARLNSSAPELELERMLQKKKQEELSAFGVVGKVRRGR